MVRKEREKSPSGIYHVMLRGINRQTIFEDEEDRLKFLETLKRYKGISQYELYSYCLMDNHVHLLIKEVEETLAEAIKRISSSYVHWYNLKYERVGHLFQERFRSENVSMANFLKVLRYIHQNPLKAGLESSVWKCRWTSIREYVERAEMVDVDLGFGLFSEDRSETSRLFFQYMQQQNQDECLDYVVKVRKSDCEVRDYLEDIGIANSSILQRLDRADRNRILIELKGLEGVNLRQISRVTGISKSVIQRVR
jgi:putative transposase